MTPRECLAKARDCERMADDNADGADQRMLFTTAQHWRSLAKTAKEPGTQITSSAADAAQFE